MAPATVGPRLRTEVAARVRMCAAAVTVHGWGTYCCSCAGHPAAAAAGTAAATRAPPPGGGVGTGCYHRTAAAHARAVLAAQPAAAPVARPTAAIGMLCAPALGAGVLGDDIVPVITRARSGGGSRSRSTRRASRSGGPPAAATKYVLYESWFHGLNQFVCICVCVYVWAVRLLFSICTPVLRYLRGRVLRNKLSCAAVSSPIAYTGDLYKNYSDGRLHAAQRSTLNLQSGDVLQCSSLGNVDLDQVLGGGAFAEVWRARVGSQRSAIKLTKVEHARVAGIESSFFVDLDAFVRRINDPTITEFAKYLLRSQGIRQEVMTCVRTRERLHGLLMQEAGHDVQTLFKAVGKSIFERTDAMVMVLHLVAACAVICRFKRTHNDVKPANVLTLYDRFVLADYNSVLSFSDYHDGRGTLAFMSLDAHERNLVSPLNDLESIFWIIVFIVFGFKHPYADELKIVDRVQCERQVLAWKARTLNRPAVLERFIGGCGADSGTQVVMRLIMEEIHSQSISESTAYMAYLRVHECIKSNVRLPESVPWAGKLRACVTCVRRCDAYVLRAALEGGVTARADGGVPAAFMLQARANGFTPSAACFLPPPCTVLCVCLRVSTCVLRGCVAAGGQVAVLEALRALAIVQWHRTSEPAARGHVVCEHAACYVVAFV